MSQYNPIMKPSEKLLRQLHAEKILAARAMTPEQRLSAGGELFDAACEVARMGIRMQFPSASEPEVLAHLARRIHLMEKRGE